jgi:hypothetical protein
LFDKGVVGDSASLWETIHAAANCKVDESISDVFAEVVGDDELFGDDVDGNADVFLAR